MRRIALRSVLVLVLGTVIVLVGSCSDSGSPTAQAPSAAGEGEGAELYAARCASCHGADLRGTDRGPSHLSIVYEPGHHSDDAFRSAIRNGSPQHHWDFGAMPPVEGLTDDEVDSVIEFVRTEQERRGFES